MLVVAHLLQFIIDLFDCLQAVVNQLGLVSFMN